MKYTHSPNQLSPVRRRAKKLVASLSDAELQAIKKCVKDKLISPVTQGRDRMSVAWRRQLREILDSIDDPLGLLNSDWTEVYYAVEDHGAEHFPDQELFLSKIGPDGRKCWSD